MFPRHLKPTLLLITALGKLAIATNFDQCLAQIKEGKFGAVGGTDNRGYPVNNITNATAITYKLCISACGTEPESFSWGIFSQQFSAWLLPWLALISQLPFGANDKMYNVESMILNIGSPVLGAYSLALTTLNGRWIAKYYSPFKHHPITSQVVCVLSGLQQAPLRTNNLNSSLDRLVTLPESIWWSELTTWMNQTNSWSASAAASISWVIIAYFLTVINSFTSVSVSGSTDYNGQAVGSIWLWLLPIVVGWLQVSPKCDSKDLHSKLARVNADLPIPSHNGRASEGPKAPESYPIYLASHPESSLRHDESCSPPIFNYARAFTWANVVKEVGETFKRVLDHEGNLNLPPRQGTGIWKRVFVAGCLGLALQWGTAGAAMVITWFTPTTGLGCRSLAYLFYASMSTLVWICLLLSSILSHYVPSPMGGKSVSTRIASALAVSLRRFGKIAAACNALGMILTCAFQFSNLFNNCYCNSSVLWWGNRAYNVISLTQTDVARMKGAWIGGVVLASGSALLFGLFINISSDPTFSSHGDKE